MPWKTIWVDEEDSDYTRLENTRYGHFKYWEVCVSGTRVIRRWGAIGTRGQSMTGRYSSIYKAKRASYRMIDKKLGEGYVRV